MKTINNTKTYDAIEIRDLYNGASVTFKKCDKLATDGYHFIPGNDWRLGRRPKWSNCDTIRVAQTNHRLHGKTVQTLWAVRLKENKL